MSAPSIVRNFVLINKVVYTVHFFVYSTRVINAVHVGTVCLETVWLFFLLLIVIYLVFKEHRGYSLSTKKLIIGLLKKPDITNTFRFVNQKGKNVLFFYLNRYLK